MSETKPVRVIGVRSRQFTVDRDGRETVVVVPKRLRYLDPGFVDPLAVGDRVLLGEGEPPVVTSVLPRSSLLSRPASGRPGKRQILATNLDLAIVVLAARFPAWKPATVDRYLVLASAAGVRPLLCINKIDLDPAVVDDPVFRVYERLGVPVVFVSALGGSGLHALAEAMRGKGCVLIGPSGSGKSSLINASLSGAALRVGDVSERTGKGTHTTTWVELQALPGGGFLVDSPGIRVLDLSGVEVAELGGHFPEIVARRGNCRFDDCRHLDEPGCAVKQAVEEGSIAAHRYDSYLRIHRSLVAGLG